MAGLPGKGDLKSSFDAQKKPQPKLMYHAIPVAPQGDEIRASTNYGATIRPEILQALGVEGTDHPPLVFASPYLTKALAFGLDTQLGEKLLNGGIEGSDGELVIVTNRDVAMARKREGKIFAFSAEGFVDLPYADRQSVSKNPVKFSDAQVVLEITSAEDLMRAGLQIFSFKETATELRNDSKLEAFLSGKGSVYDTLQEQVKQGRAVWENLARGINPNPVLAEKLGISLSARQPEPKNIRL